jgi:uncharacterized protein (TIGR03032 family)
MDRHAWGIEADPFSVRFREDPIVSEETPVATGSSPGSTAPEESSSGTDSSSTPSEPRRISTTHSPSFARILSELRASLLVSTYQTGKVAVVRARGEDLLITYHNFERPMGIAISREQIAIGTNTQVWFLASAPQIAHAIGSESQYDSCYLARGSHVTGEIHGHEMAWSGRELWIVNTLFSCLCSIGGGHSFIPRWKPRFVSALAAEDRCHLNGLALQEARPRYLSCLGETDTQRGWRAGKATGGCVIDVPSGQTVLRGLSMPHSPRVQQGRLWFLESGRGRLMAVNPQSGSLETMAELPGYARGLTFHGPYAFVGLSRMRESSSIEGLPIASSIGSLKCGVAVVELASGRMVAMLEFVSGIDEVFDVRLDPYSRTPFFSGPDARADGTPPIWLIPSPRFDLMSP